MGILVTWKKTLPNAGVQSSGCTSGRRFRGMDRFRRDATPPYPVGPTGATGGVSAVARFHVVLLLFWLALPATVTAQTEADRESVTKVIEQLFSIAGEDQDELAHLPVTWSVAIARFAKGDSREIEIPVQDGETYQVVGGSESYDTDVDICVYGPDGQLVSCDTMEDNFPVVTFTGQTAGTYRAVLTAASVRGGPSYAGMIVLRILVEGADGAGSGR